jgi:dipeptidyl aminopeptidase/acylaminoacyl peptidase
MYHRRCGDSALGRAAPDARCGCHDRDRLRPGGRVHSPSSGGVPPDARPTAPFSTPSNILSTDVGPRLPYVAMSVQQPNGRSGIWLAHVDSVAQRRPFIAESYSAVSPRISPDGRLIAYTSNRTGQSEEYVRALPSGAEDVKASANGGEDPAWSPGGNELFSRTFDDPANEACSWRKSLRHPVFHRGTTGALRARALPPATQSRRIRCLSQR